MDIDLLIELDDELSASVARSATNSGVSVEEWLRSALLNGVGRPYQRPLPGYDAIMRPMVAVDLRT